MRIILPITLLSSSLLTITNAFSPARLPGGQRIFATTQNQRTYNPTKVASALFLIPKDNNDHRNAVIDNDESSSSSSSSDAAVRIGITTIIMAVLTSHVGVASAAGPDWGIFEGRTGSLLHPLMMGGLLAFSLSTAFLGFDWRRLRTIGDDISALKRTLPTLPEGVSTVKAALDLAQAAETKDPSYISTLMSALETEQNIAALQEERKQLSQKAPRDKHFSQGAMLAFLGTAFAIEGPLNTYARAGKLFPGPHLYAGAGLVVLWALAAACVPSMIKGNDTARTIHIGANVAGIALFAWQVTTGIPILLKVLENTHWP